MVIPVSQTWTLYLLGFVFILIRFLAMLASSPIFYARAIPPQVKIGMSMYLAVVVLLIQGPMLTAVPDPVMMGLFAFREMAIGLVIGFSLTMIFAGIQLAGMISGYQMSFAIANVMDPATNTQVSLVSEFHYIMAALVFLIFNWHHLLLRGLIDSFHVYPIGTFALTDRWQQFLTTGAADLFIIALHIALPVMATILVVDVALGIMARSVPQMNVFFVGLPLKVGLGLALLMLVYGMFGNFVNSILADFFRNLSGVMAGG